MSIHLRHSNNMILLVSSLSHLLNPISFQVLLNLPPKQLFSLSPQPLSFNTASQLVYLFQSCPDPIFSPWSNQGDFYKTLSDSVTTSDKTHQLSPTEWSNAFFFQVICTNFPQYKTPDTSYQIEVFQHSKEMKEFNLSL